MDEHELLIRHARAWAEKKSRPLDADVLSEALRLRHRYDESPSGVWPTGSAERLVLVTWPAYGEAPPSDTEMIGETLDTFWGFLRATGRMSASSAKPADLRKEVRRALPKMAAAYDDPARHSQGRVLQDFGAEVGIELDGAESDEDLQQRLDQLMHAWNSLPQEERQRRMPDPSAKGVRAQEWTSELDEPQVAPGDVHVSADLARTADFVRQCLRLAAWADGREVTARGLLRPAVAREAYRNLDLWQWERSHDPMRRRGPATLADPETEAVLANAAANSWRSAGDCLALDRLWYGVEAAHLIDYRGGRAVRDRPDPTTDEEWRDLALVLLIAMCLRLGDYRTEPLAGVLLMARVAEGPVRLTAVREWWDSRCPDQLRNLRIDYWTERLEDVWHLFADCNLWRVDEESFQLTDLGRDFLITYLNAQNAGMFDD